MDDERPPRLWLGMWKRFLVGGALIVLLCGGATAAVTVRTATQIADEVFPKLNQIHTPKGLISSIYTGGPKTFLILGSDKRYGSKNSEEREAAPHSDTMLLVRFDPEQDQTSVLSVPRDLLVSIKTPEGRVYYPEKINFAYTLGSTLPGHDEGANLAAETVKHVLPGLELNGIIDVTFAGFIRVVDSLGCVYVNVDHHYYNDNIGTPETDYTSIDLQPGYQKLCYENALDYVRYRHTDSDFVRVARQQDFLRDLREQVSPNLGEIDKVAKTVGRAISTNFSPSASILLELAKLIGFSQGKPLRQVKFQTDNVDDLIGGGSYVTTTPELAEATLHDFLYGHQRVQPPSGHSSSSGAPTATTVTAPVRPPARRARTSTRLPRLTRSRPSTPRCRCPSRCSTPACRAAPPHRKRCAPTRCATPRATSTTPTRLCSSRASSGATTTWRAPTGWNRRSSTTPRKPATSTAAPT